MNGIINDMENGLKNATEPDKTLLFKCIINCYKCHKSDTLKEVLG
jgi:hypothetical protein